MLNLYPHQTQALTVTSDLTHVAYYHAMGLGKTFTGAEKLKQLGAKVNLVICQKSKINDWCTHFSTFYPEFKVYDLTDKTKAGKRALEYGFWVNYYNQSVMPSVLVVNYELAFRRRELLDLQDFTLMLDESSLIQNDQAKRTKFILRLHAKNVILLSGTPTGGKYENLWTQLHLLGWKINKDLFFNQYVNFHYDDTQGFPRMVIDGYKNEERLKRKMREHGCHFLRSEEVFDLPEQIDIPIKIPETAAYKKFKRDRIITLNGKELIGDTTLTKLLYERQLCGLYNADKLEAFTDLVQSTEERLIVFYNFTDEWHQLGQITDILNKPSGVVNGQFKHPEVLDKYDNAVLFVQYQAGAMGLNLQKANKIIYYSPPLSSELFEQSKKRIHRIGQGRTCFYYYLTCGIEEKIYKTLAMRRDYTERLFEEG